MDLQRKNTLNACYTMAGVAVNPILCLGASCHRQAMSWRFRFIGKPPASRRTEMTEEELKEKIADIIDREDKNSFALPCMDIANQILTLIREVGYVHKSTIPNATICPKCNEMHWIR